MTTRNRFSALYSGPTPAWDIGRPQPELLVAFDELALTGSVLDLGCGTGENTLELARRGLEAWGGDLNESLAFLRRHYGDPAPAISKISECGEPGCYYVDSFEDLAFDW